MPKKPKGGDELPPRDAFDDAEPTPTGGHLILPGGRIVPVELRDQVEDGPPPVKHARGPKPGMPPWVKQVALPLVTAAVTAFLAAGGAIQIGAADHSQHIHLTPADIENLNNELEKLTADLASMRAEVLIHKEKPAHNDAEKRIRALELQQVELSTALNIHLKESDR